MKYHKYDPVTLLYSETVEADEQPENSVGGILPDQTQYYTLSYQVKEWVSVVRPEYEVIDNKFVKKVQEQPDSELVQVEQPIQPEQPME